MSLHKTYRVQCEGISLASRLGLTSSGPGVLFHEHPDLGPASSESPAKARRMAIASGWTRTRRTLPISGGPNAPTTEIPFDLCPSCTATIGARS
jgi:hypothetical protein